MDIFEKIIQAKKEDRPLVLATVIDVKGSAPRETGAKMIVWRDGGVDGTIGGGAIEKTVVDEALKLFATQQAKIFHYDLSDLKMQCGGKMTVFLEPIVSRPPLFIFGAGHIGLALSKIGDMLGFSITVVDNRPEFANRERFPDVHRVIAKDYIEALDGLNFSPDACIVIVTYKHLHDQAILEQCVQKPFRYLGMIGSKSKVVKSLKSLKDKGVNKALLSRIHSPIGLNIGAQTPEEIAVAIAAEIIGVRSGADISSLQMKLDYD